MVSDSVITTVTSPLIENNKKLTRILMLNKKTKGEKSTKRLFLFSHFFSPQHQEKLYPFENQLDQF